MPVLQIFAGVYKHTNINIYISFDVYIPTDLYAFIYANLTNHPYLYDYESAISVLQNANVYFIYVIYQIHLKV